MRFTESWKNSKQGNEFMATRLEKTVREIEQAITSITDDETVIRAFRDKLAEALTVAKYPIDWHQSPFEKYETGTYRGFTIVHHFRNMASPYRVILTGPPSNEDLILFGTQTEEEMTDRIDLFYENKWTRILNEPTLKRDMTDVGKFLFIRTYSLHPNAREWSSSLEVLHLHQSISMRESIDYDDLEKLVKGLQYGVS